jgi:hypothetical protein
VIPATLVTGGSPARREACIADACDPVRDTAIILEGLPSGTAPLQETQTLHLARIAPGCMCCTGNLTLRVTLNRMLRKRPQRIYIALATSEHLESLRTFLSSAPYDEILMLTQDLQV